MRLSALLLAFVLPVLVIAQRPIDTFLEESDNFFKRNVYDGLVDYTLLKNEPAQLNELARLITEIDEKTLEGNERLAYLINAYNILVVKGVCDHYPTNSVMDVDGFFKKKKFDWFGGASITLDKLEHGLIKPAEDDRLHFVLVCGAKTCPPLIEGGYLPSKLEKQLDLARENAINDPSWVLIDPVGKQALYPKLLDWYEKDFTGGETDLRGYLNKYRKTPIAEDVTMKESYYDWTLNDSKLRGKFSVPAFADGSTAPATSIPAKNDPAASNVRVFTPSALLRKGQVEVKLFNNLYTQTAWFDPDGENADLGGRGNFFTSTASVLLGTTESARLNFGLDMNVKGVRNDSANASPLATFRFEDDMNNRWALASLGPKVKFQPFKAVKRLSVQSTLWIPVADELEGTPWIDWQRLTWWNQFFFDRSFGDHFQVFTEADLLVRIPQVDNTGIQVFTPLSLFTSWFPTNFSTVYGMFQYAPTRQWAPEFGTPDDAYYMQYGFGAKYQVTKSLEVEVLFTDFFTGRAQGAGETYNVGLRWLR